jgi:hypothetical protein
MYCYLCFVEQRGHHCLAHALCQHCGAGICAEHLVALNTAPVCGMAGSSGSGWKMLCRRCYATLYPQAQSHTQPPRKQPSEERRHWWQVAGWFRKKTVPDLPTPEEAIATAELLLKQQYEH